ncbi:MAG TPA: hypothetical protein VNC60_08695 [Actinomycetota bacterium]|nr:hypothetical protein [Actinomycetota bacterium]
MSASDDPLAARRVGGATHVAGVIGWPVEHSLSPQIHNAAFAALGLDWTYVPLPVAPGAMRAAADGLVALGFRGANVTMPHKTAAAELADELSDEATRLRAVNTFVVHGDRLAGHNTDVPGFERFLRRDAGFEPQGRSALVYGAGGAARAVALALALAGLATLTVAVRDPSRAGDVGAAVDGAGVQVDVGVGDRPVLAPGHRGADCSRGSAARQTRTAPDRAGFCGETRGAPRQHGSRRAIVKEPCSASSRSRRSSRTRPSRSRRRSTASSSRRWRSGASCP